jgi:hypothetical protein
LKGICFCALRLLKAARVKESCFLLATLATGGRGGNGCVQFENAFVQNTHGHWRGIAFILSCHDTYSVCRFAGLLAEWMRAGDPLTAAPALSSPLLKNEKEERAQEAAFSAFSAVSVRSGVGSIVFPTEQF